ncbi:enolase C-terminal domain-like protein [Nanoarchaeota archaeon]
MIIQSLRAEKTLNSRGEETILIIAEAKKGKVFAAAPSGSSKGVHEAPRFSSKGIGFSISFINLIGKRLVRSKTTFKSFEDLEKVESIIKEYDKTENWSLIGGSALFALEAVILKAIAHEEEKELWNFLNPNAKKLPLPLGNCIGGGKHSKKEMHPDIQEFLILPQSKHFYDAYFINLQAYKLAKRLVLQLDNTWDGEITDEKAISPNLNADQIFSLLKEINKNVESKFNTSLSLGMDVAASSFYEEGDYVYENPEKIRNPEEQLNYIKELIEKYSLYYVEDPFEEDDFDSFAKLLSQTPNTLIVGDDLTVTNPKRLKKAIKKKSVNAVIVKPNQNGSLLGTKEFVDLAKQNKIVPIISHRSGETLDSTIADLAVAWEIPMIKTGILGKERLAKLHKLLKIERALSKKH